MGANTTWDALRSIEQYLMKRLDTLRPKVWPFNQRNEAGKKFREAFYQQGEDAVFKDSRLSTMVVADVEMEAYAAEIVRSSGDGLPDPNGGFEP